MFSVLSTDGMEKDTLGVCSLNHLGRGLDLLMFQLSVCLKTTSMDFSSAIFFLSAILIMEQRGKQLTKEVA